MSKQFTISEDQLEKALGIENPPGNWLEDVAKQLREIASLPKGWDSYGSPAPDVRKVQAAWGLLNILFRVLEFPKPHVNPTPDGGVQFDWEEGQRYFELALVGERAATYLFRDDGAGVEETGEVFEDEPSTLVPVVDYLRRFSLGPQKTSAFRSSSFLGCERDVVVVK